jgi:Predicted membrane protein
MQLYETVSSILGLSLEARDLTFIQVSLRAIIVFIVSLAIVRVGNKRFLSKMSAFDAILGFIMASMLARAVNGSAPFFPTLGAGFVLVGLHALIARLAFRSDAFGNVVKGTSQTIVTNGKPDRQSMAHAMLSEKDLLEEARLNGKVMRLEDIQLATLERNGQVSIVLTR